MDNLKKVGIKMYKYEDYALFAILILNAIVAWVYTVNTIAGLVLMMLMIMVGLAYVVVRNWLWHKHGQEFKFEVSRTLVTRRKLDHQINQYMIAERELRKKMVLREDECAAFCEGVTVGYYRYRGRGDVSHEVIKSEASAMFWEWKSTQQES